MSTKQNVLAFVFMFRKKGTRKPRQGDRRLNNPEVSHQSKKMYQNEKLEEPSYVWN